MKKKLINWFKKPIGVKELIIISGIMLLFALFDIVCAFIELFTGHYTFALFDTFIAVFTIVASMLFTLQIKKVKESVVDEKETV
jgi:ABC-type multidrug transport system fused ATPase/permease subunit